jgi:hypothetical protein
MTRVLMNFQCRKGWSAHFLLDDCRTPVRSPTRFYNFDTLDDLVALVSRTAEPEEALAQLAMNAHRWSRGSIFLQLTDEQFETLTR